MIFHLGEVVRYRGPLLKFIASGCPWATGVVVKNVHTSETDFSTIVPVQFEKSGVWYISLAHHETILEHSDAPIHHDKKEGNARSHLPIVMKPLSHEEYKRLGETLLRESKNQKHQLILMEKKPLIDQGTLENLVFTALGEACMCWVDGPNGVFDSEKANEIGYRLIHAILHGEEREVVND